MKIRDLLGGLPNRRSTKVIDGQHPMGAPAQGDMDAFKPDMLPLNEEQNGHQGHCNRNILVAVTGHELDRELVTLAGKVAREKKAAVRPQIFAVYGIEVPRTKAIDDEMPEETDRAHQALNHAAGVALQMDIEIEPEIVQSRHFGHSLVDEAEAHECALLILGLPYRIGLNGQIEGSDAVDFVLRNAPCKVWVVRGQPPEKLDHPEHEYERSYATR